MAYKLNTDDIQTILMKEYGMADQKADKVVKSFFAIIMKALEEEHYVKVKGLGTFKLIDVEARRSVDVNTGEGIEIPSHRKVSFVPDNALKGIINKPFAHFETVELNDGVLLDEMPEERESMSVEESLLADKAFESDEPVYADSSEGDAMVNVGEASSEINEKAEFDEDLNELEQMLKDGERQKRTATSVLLAIVGIVFLSVLIYWIWSKYR